MPEIIVTCSGEPVGRLTCTDKFAEQLLDVWTHGNRLELSGGIAYKYGEPPKVDELSISPLPAAAALTDEEREAVELSAQFFELRPSGRVGIALRSLLERLK